MRHHKWARASERRLLLLVPNKAGRTNGREAWEAMGQLPLGTMGDHGWAGASEWRLLLLAPNTSWSSKWSGGIGSHGEPMGNNGKITSRTHITIGTKEPCENNFEDAHQYWDRLGKPWGTMGSHGKITSRTHITTGTDSGSHGKPWEAMGR